MEALLGAPEICVSVPPATGILERMPASVKTIVSPSAVKLGEKSAGPDVPVIKMLELDGQDLRREPLEVRKQTLASVLRGSLPGVQFNAHLTHPGDIVFEHACKNGA